MPRRTRMYLPGHPYHVFQRGNIRAAFFVGREDYQHYLDLWSQCSGRYGVAVHAYRLMTNHIHFLATPPKTDSISRTTRDVGSRYAYYFNRRYSRTGTLWEGRHKASLVRPAVFSRMQPLHRLEPGCGRNGGKGGSVSLVELSGQCLGSR